MAYQGGKKKGGSKGDAPNVDWPLLKRTWIQANLDPSRVRRYTLKDLSVDTGVAYKTIRTHAADEGWAAELIERAQEQHEAVLEEMRDRFVVDETEIRLRQQRIARKASEIVEQALDKLLVGIAASEDAAEVAAKLAPKEIHNLLRASLEQERKAMGLPDEFMVRRARDEDEDEKRKTPEERQRRTQRLTDLGASLLEKLTGGPGGA